MPVENFENLNSSALFRVKVDKSSVYVTYKSNIDKEYEFSCENTSNFTKRLSETLETKGSCGKLLHSLIKENKLVPVNK